MTKEEIDLLYIRAHSSVIRYNIIPIVFLLYKDAAYGRTYTEYGRGDLASRGATFSDGVPDVER